MSAKSGLFLLSSLVLFFLCLFMPLNSLAEDNPWAGKIRPGFMAGDGDVGTDFYLDVLIPLYGDQRQLFFFNPNLRVDDHDGNEQNVGFGYRSLGSGKKYILGANVYYDTMESQAGHRYQQWGIGAEVLTHWIDLRANYYNVFGDDDNILSGSGGADSYIFSGNSLLSVGGSVEQALDGFDAEISVLIPGISDVMETRLAATYYRYDADYARDPDGWRGRIEMRPVQAINFSVEYRDDDLRGSDTFVGAYFEIPFSIENLFSGKNPFAGAGDAWSFGKGVRRFEERMTDKVVRDRHIVTASSSAAVGDEVAIVDDAMIFVNQDNPEMGDGSFENPYQTLTQAAEDETRFQPGAWIYVFSSDETADTYENTSFTLLDGQVLWGQGYEHPVYGLGGGPMPILDGGYTEVPLAAGAVDPVIWLANNNEIMGLTIQRGLEGIYLDSRLEGRTTQGINIHHNIIRDNLSPVAVGSGIHIYNRFDADDLGGKTLSYVITDNLIENNDRAGIFMRHEADNGELVGTTFETTISGNTIVDHNQAIDVSLYVAGSDPTLIQDVTVSNLLENNTVLDNQRGIRIYNYLNARTNVSGMYVANINSQISNTIRNNSITSFSDGHGVYVENQINAQTYLNSLVQQARTSNLLENNIMAGAYAGIFVRNFSFSGGDFNDVTTETRLVNNAISVEEPRYTGTYGISVSNDFHKNGVLAQGPIAASVFGQANSVDDLSTTTGLVTGVRLLASARTSGSADDYTTAIIQDFGGGAFDSTGNNSFTGASGSEKAFSIGSSLFSAMAENNWWGTTDAGLISSMVEATGSGSVDYEPYLLSAP